MLRNLILVAALFILPFVVFAIYEYLRRSSDQRGSVVALFEQAPVRRLVALGVIIGFLGLMTMAVLDTSRANPAYQPPLWQRPVK